MPQKIIIGNKGKAWRLELEADVLSGKSLGEKVKGNDLKAELEGYEFEISGASDSSGFPHMREAEGIGLKRVIFKKGWGIHKRPKGGKKEPKSTPEGLRKRRTIRGRVLSDKTAQVNLIVLKEGNKKFEEVFPDQNKKEEVKIETPAVSQ